MRVKYILFLFLLIFSAKAGFCQYIPVFKFTTKEGLPHSVVFRITQDKRGFLWFSTDNGISAYDGSSFKNYTTKQGLRHNTVISVAEAENGDKWVTTNGGGISILKNNAFLNPFSHKLPSHLYFMHFDKEKTWCTSHEGKLYLISAGENDTTIKEIMMPGFRFVNFLQTQNGQVYLSGHEGLCTINGTSVVRYLPGIVNGKVSALAYNPKDSTLIVSIGSRILYIKNGGLIKTIAVNINYEISDLLLDKQGKLWVCGPGKVILVEGENIVDLTGQLQLEKTLINDLFEDRDGNIWIATYGYGVLCISSLKILTYKATQEAITNNVISLVSLGDSIYSGSFGTVACISNEKVRVLPFRHMSPVDYLYFIKKLDSNLYIGTPRGILLKNPRNGSERKLHDSGIISLCKNIDGSIWIGSYNACRLLVNNVASGTLNLPRRRYNAIEHDISGTLYFGTDSGLFILKNNVLQHITVGFSPLSNSINYILNDTENRIWLATNSGVFILDKEKQSALQVFEQTLTGLKCTALQEDGPGNIWIGSFNGVYKLSNNKIYSYTTASGLVSNEVLSLTIDNRHRLWVGTVNGISCISTTEAWRDKPISAFYITEVLAGQDKTFHFPNSLYLDYKDADIKISFVGIDFPVADRVEYQYTIENLINDWRNTASTSLELPSLPAGSYIFKIKARKNNGEWSKTISLPIYIQQPYWQQWWFKLLISLCLLLLLGALVRKYVRYRELKHKEKASVESQMVMLKQQALRAMINPHFVFNCLNNILGYIHKNERDIAKSYLIQFSRFFRMTLEHSKHEYIKLSEEINRLELYLSMEQLRFGPKMQYRINNALILQKDVWIPNMIIQPFIENAILHGITPKETTGTVNVSFDIYDEKNLIIIIDDDGPGFKNGRQQEELLKGGDKTSLGMKLSVERLRLLQTLTNKKHTIFFDNCGTHTGAEVKIIIPLVFAEPRFTTDFLVGQSTPKSASSY